MANCGFEYQKETNSYKELVDTHGEVIAAGIMAQYNGRPPKRFYQESIDELADKEYNETQRYSEEDFQDVLSSLTFEFISGLKDQTTDQLLGTGIKRGTIPTMMLRNAYIVRETGQPASTELAEKLFKLEMQMLEDDVEDSVFDEFDELIETNGILAEETEDGYFPKVPGDSVDDSVRNTYLDVYKYWNGGISEIGKTKERIEQDKKFNNADIVGWRELLVRKINSSGYVLTQKEEGYSEVADDQDVLEKIYGRSSLQEDPANKLTGKMRQLLSTIPSNEKTFLGYSKFLPAQDVFRELAKEFAGATNFETMRLRMKNLSEYKPSLKPVYDFMNNMDKQEAALFRSAFGLSSTQFMLMKFEIEEDKLRSKMFNPNENSVERATLTEWKNNSVEDRIAKDNAVYKKVGDELTLKKEGALERILTDGRTVLKAILIDNQSIETADGSTHPVVQAYSRVLYNMGIDMSTNGTLGSHMENINRLIQNGHSVSINGKSTLLKGTDMLRYLTVLGGPGTTLENLLNEFAETRVEKGKDGSKRVTFYSKQAKLRNIHETKGRAIRHIAQFSPLFKENKGDAFVNLSGNIIHPINLPHNLSRIVERLQAPTVSKVKAGTERKNALDIYRGSKFFKPTSTGEHQSILLRALESNEFAQQFQVYDIDGLKLKGKISDYENFAEVQSLTTRLQAWYNNGNANVSLISVPTQADRTKLSFITFPRLSNLGKGSKFEISSTKNKKEIIQDMIIQDLVRMKEAKKVLADNSPEAVAKRQRLTNYYGKNKDGVVKALSNEFMQFTAKDEEGNQIVTNRELRTPNNSTLEYTLADKIEDYLSDKKNAGKDKSQRVLDEEVHKEIEQALEEMSNQMLDYFDQQAADLIEKMTSLGIPFAEENFFKENKTIEGIETLEEFAKAFVFDDAIGRLEIAKMLRGPMAQFKNTTDFYKRMALVTTPGIELATVEELQGTKEVDGIANYGMPETFSEIVLNDFELDLTPQQTQRAKEQAEDLYKGAVESGLPVEQAERIRDSYLKGALEGTDAQSAITLDHYRDLQQGLGNWDIEEEKAWEAYRNTGRFEYQEGFVPVGFNVGDAVPLYPMKPFYESVDNLDGVVTTDITKNSYTVLLKSETEGNPLKDQLRKRMEAVEEFEGLQPISVANFVTTKKAKVGNPVDLRTTKESPELQMQELDSKLREAQTNTLKSKNIRFPQIIPPKKTSYATFNRQVRKNTLANVEDNFEYTIDPGTNNEFEISGKDLKDIYHKAINRKIELDIKKLKDEIGFGRLDKSKTDAEKLESIKRIHQNLRNIIRKENMERDLPDNYSEGLNILEDAGIPQFELSLDFPTYYEKFERIILGMAINRVFKQKIAGEETVQVADLGGYATDSELKFYTVEKDKKGNPILSHMEVAVREDIAERLGIKPGEELTPEKARMIGYRIPNQGKSSTTILRIKKILPKNYKKAIIVPQQITKLTGSDFDIDKMFLIFPETSQTDAGLVKVSPSYKHILSGDLNIDSITNESILNNIIYDTIEAVQSSRHHFNETMAPLDETTLEDLAGEMEQKAGISSSIDFNSWRAEVDVGIRNTLGVSLRGLWANALAGHSVAQHGEVNVVSQRVITLIDENGVERKFDKLLTKSPETSDPIDADVPINIILSRYLSAAVDAGKKPYQYALNDNVPTFPAEMYWLTFVGDSKSLHYFLNQPVIRQAVELVQGKYGGDVRKFKEAFIESGGFGGISLEDPIIPMSIEDLKTFNINPQTAAENFLKIVEAGRELRDMFKVIAPDSMDGMNSADSLKSYKSRQNKFNPLSRVKGEPLFYGGGTDLSVIDQFLDEDGNFPMQAGFNNLFEFMSSEFGARLFPKVFSAGMQELELQYMEALGKDKVTPEEMKELRRAAMLHVITREGSPLREFFSPTHLQTRYLNKEDNLVTQFKAITSKNPKLQDNKFIMKFEEDADNETEDIQLLSFDTSIKLSKFEKDSIIKDALEIYNFPEKFAENPDNPTEVEEIQNLMEDLFMNAIIVNGFKVSKNSYADMIPVQFFTEARYSRYGQEIQKGEKFKDTVAEFYKKQNLNDQNYFNGFLPDYLRQHGDKYAGNTPIIYRNQIETLYPAIPGAAVRKDPKLRPLYAALQAKGTDSVSVYRLADNGYYYKLNPLGGRIMESYDVGQESLVNKITENSDGTLSSVVKVSQIGLRRQQPLNRQDMLRGQITGQDRTDIICK